MQEKQALILGADRIVSYGIEIAASEFQLVRIPIGREIKAKSSLIAHEENIL